MAREWRSTSYSIPAPTGGWNARDALDTMDENQAVRLDNYFPDTSAVVLRNGYREHAPGVGTGTSKVEMLAEFSSAAGTRQLIAAADNKLYNASTLGAAATNITGAATITSNRWQYVNFRATGNNYLIMVNGVDSPLSWDGTTLAVISYTTTSPTTLDEKNFIHVNVFKNRLYFVEKNTTRYWYGDINSYSGNCLDLDLGAVFKRGGYLAAIGSWSRDGGVGPQDLCVFISSMGEVLVYSGTDPDATDWSLVNRGFCAPPLGRRCFFNLNSDLIIMTTEGLIPMSQVMGSGDSAKAVGKLTDTIQEAFNSAAASYSSNFGWEPVVYYRGRYLAINIPTVEAVTSEQAVMNLLTGAWCRFMGMNASSWATFNEKLYFGGMDGKVYQADYGLSDNAQNIRGGIKTAFNYFGDRIHTKKVTLVRPVMAATEGMTMDLNIDVDFGNRTINNDIVIDGTSGELWSDGVWDVSEWEDDGTTQVLNWYSVDGIGRAISVRLESESQNAEVAITAFSVIFEPGGVL